MQIIWNYIQETYLLFNQSGTLRQQMSVKAFFVMLCFLFIIVSVLFIRSFLRRKKIKKYFGLTDLSSFQIRVAKKENIQHATGNNTYILKLPHWLFQDENGDSKAKIFNKIIWEKSILWLHLKNKVYTLTTKDPWTMLFLVHTLRLNGHSIEPCSFEQEKQKQLEIQYVDMDNRLETLVNQINGEEAFVEICKNRLQLRGYLVQDAPGNPAVANLFIQKEGRSGLVKCLFVSRSHIIGLEEMCAIKESFRNAFAENGILITTGKLTVYAARYAMDNQITTITDFRLFYLLNEEKEIRPGEEFLRWELTGKDLMQLIPQRILSGKNFRK